MKQGIQYRAPWASALTLLVVAASSIAAEEPLRRIVPAPASAPQYGPSYAQRIVRAIKSNIVWQEKDIPDARCEVEVELDAQGNLLARRVVSSLGHPEWCPTVLRALDRTERIPADVDGRVPPRLSITFKSKE